MKEISGALDKLDELAHKWQEEDGKVVRKRKARSWLTFALIQDAAGILRSNPECVAASNTAGLCLSRSKEIERLV